MTRLRTNSTDSQEILCEYGLLIKAFWVPENGTLRFWKDRERETLTGVYQRKQVQQAMKRRYVSTKA